MLEVSILKNIHATYFMIILFIKFVVLYSFDNVTMFSEPGAVHILMSD